MVGHEIFTVALRGLAGGTLVVAFALISQSVGPKRFAGLFGAAPAVAIASLTITLLDKGPRDAHNDGVAMLAGAGGMILCALSVVSLLKRMPPARAAVTGLAVWALVAGALLVPVLVG